MSSVPTLAFVPGGGALWPLLLILLICCLSMYFGMRGRSKKQNMDQPTSPNEKSITEDPESSQRRTL